MDSGQLMEGSVRSTLAITYGDEERDLKVTFGLIDRVRRHVPWEKMTSGLASDEKDIDFAMMAKFVYLNLLEAGFKNVDIDEIYDEMVQSEGNKQGYIALVGQIIAAYQPRGKKKSVKLVNKTKSRKKA